jgi:hypothetical protein
MKNSDRANVTISEETVVAINTLQNSNQLPPLALVSVDEKRLCFLRPDNMQPDFKFKCLLLTDKLPPMVLDGTPSNTSFSSFSPWINKQRNVDMYCTKSVECYQRTYSWAI